MTGRTAALELIGERQQWAGSDGQSPTRTSVPAALPQVRFEPDPAILFLCCVRSQREKCGMSEKLHAVAQQNIGPFVQVAAWIRRRTYRSRTKPPTGRHQ
tara:strand:- start:1610 stop:1909 length:300 start_codon:yes stop_codon:yes gene_type:complete